MMPMSKLVRMVGRNTMRSKKHFIMSLFGIVFGIGLFVLFLAFSAGVGVALNRAFPVDQIEVRPKRAVIEAMEARLDDALVSKISADPRVKEAVPRMQLAMPASGVGYFEGQAIRLFLESVIDGIDEKAITDPRSKKLFRDWDADELKPCAAKQEQKCPPGGLTNAADPTTPANPACRVVTTLSCDDDERYYCDQKDRKCHHRVPVVMSPALLETYNNQFARGNNLPAIPGNVDAFIEKKGAKAMRFHITLGRGMNPRKLEAPPRKVEATIVGMDPAAMKFGATVPIQYIKRWREEYLGEGAAASYSSVRLTVRSPSEVSGLIADLEKQYGLTNDDDTAEMLSRALWILTLILLGISVLLLVTSAISIAHNFFMQVSERRREIGTMRAVGATRGDVTGIILGEAIVLGLVGGLLGMGFAYGLSLVADFFFAQTRDFPYKPDSLFLFQPTILALGLGVSVFFCFVGGLLPARKAAKMPPAQALST